MATKTKKAPAKKAVAPAKKKAKKAVQAVQVQSESPNVNYFEILPDRNDVAVEHIYQDGKEIYKDNIVLHVVRGFQNSELLIEEPKPPFDAAGTVYKYKVNPNL